MNTQDKETIREALKVYQDESFFLAEAQGDTVRFKIRNALAALEQLEQPATGQQGQVIPDEVRDAIEDALIDASGTEKNSASYWPEGVSRYQRHMRNAEWYDAALSWLKSQSTQKGGDNDERKT
jgi:hypothetical protein